MKLLDSKEIQNRKKAFSEVDLYKTLKIKKDLEEEVLKLKEFQDSEPERKKLVAEFEVFMKGAQEKKAHIINEIKELEAKREKILEPLVEEKLELMELTQTSRKKKLINLKIDQLEKIELELNSKKLKLDEEKRALEKKEKALIKWETELQNKLKDFNKLIN